MQNTHAPLNVKHLIFDWSGTISDDRKLAYESNMKVIEARGIRRLSYKEWLRRAAPSAIEFYRRIGVSGDADKLTAETTMHFDALKLNGCAPSMYPDAPDALGAIMAKGIKMSVLSSHPEGHLIQEAHRYGIADFFTSINGSVKNKSAALISALRRIHRTDAAYVGDTTYDIASARAAGIRSVSVTTGYQHETLLRLERPTVVVNSLTELKHIVVLP